MAIYLLIFSIVFIINPKRSYKIIDYTLQQFGFIDTYWNENYNDKIRYYSKEHEDLALTAIVIFKNNYLNGNGVKTFHKTCSLYKEDEKQKGINYLEFSNRNNKLVCSTIHIILIYKFYQK